MASRRRPPLTIIGQRNISLDGQTVSYTLKRSPRARCARLEIRQTTGLTLVIPRYYDGAQIYELLEKKKRWILNNLTKCYRLKPPKINGLQDGDSIPYLGGELYLEVQKNEGCEDSAQIKNNKLIIGVGNRNHKLELILEQWYRAQAAELLTEKVEQISAELGLKYNRITIRGQRSRWASCSCQRNLSFNWKLMMTPEPVVDYVIIHELLHLKEMNHAKRFWKLVAEHCPDWRERRRWLEEHEAELKARF